MHKITQKNWRNFMEDIEIAKSAKMKNIKEIAEKININEDI